MLLLLTVGFLGACANNLLSIAETPNHYAGALSAQYNVLLEDAVTLLENRNVPNYIAKPINDARLKGTPLVNAVEKALLTYEVEAAKFAQNLTTEEKVAYAAANLDRLVDELQKAFIELADAVAGAGVNVTGFN